MTRRQQQQRSPKRLIEDRSKCTKFVKCTVLLRLPLNVSVLTSLTSLSLALLAVISSTTIFTSLTGACVLPPSGELFVGAIRLTRGYPNQPKRTDKPSIPNPFVPGEHIYRAGELDPPVTTVQLPLLSLSQGPGAVTVLPTTSTPALMTSTVGNMRCGWKFLLVVTIRCSRLHT